MIRLLADIGRVNTVAILTTVAALASVAVTATVVLILNAFGLDIRFGIAMAFALAIPLAVTPPIGLVLIGLLFKVFRSEQEMRTLASYDTLTGLLSRHAFFESANSHVSLANRNKSEFVVLVMDLDHFKSINDHFGHPAGDAVLRLFGDVVNSVARRSDVVGRIGGEEFAMILPSTSTASALEFSNRLHKAIRQAVLKYGDSIIRYTASMGLASSTSENENDLEELLARADKALYEAKRNGRNQTRVYEETPEHAAAG